MTNVLVSHGYNSKTCNQALFNAFGNNLFLINEFSADCDVVRILRENGRLMSTELPLYSLNSSQRNNFFGTTNINLDIGDLENISKSLGQLLIQADRLLLESKNYDSLSPLFLEIYLFWKRFILINNIHCYICLKVPHQVSDFLLYEVASKYCTKTVFEYRSTAKASFLCSGSFTDNTVQLIKHPDLIPKKRLKETQDYFKSFSKKQTALLNKLSIQQWLEIFNIRDLCNKVESMPCLAYINKYLTIDQKEKFFQMLKNADEVSYKGIPPYGSVILLLNVEPEASINPYSTYMSCSALFISYVRSLLPEHIPLFLREHPKAFSPSHRSVNGGTFAPACLSRRDINFWKRINALKNVYYLPPWLQGDMLYTDDFKVFTIASTYVFECHAIRKNVYGLGGFNDIFSGYSPYIHSLSSGPQALSELSTESNIPIVDILEAFPWSDVLYKTENNNIELNFLTSFFEKL